MSGGRRPKGPNLVDGIEGEREAKRKLKVILETIAGTKPVAEACAELGIGEAMFHRLRIEWLGDAVKLLEPKPVGRPPKREVKEVDDLAELAQENARLLRELTATRVKADLGLLMPHVLRRGDGLRKKTKD